jgi:hypothetical protein
MNTNDTRPAAYSITPSGQKELSDNELSSLEKIAILRGKCGKYRRAMRDALDQLRPDEPAYKRLQEALEDAA